jgi:hypothetical protein
MIIWHLRGRRQIMEVLRDMHRFGLPGCSALAVLEVQSGVKKRDDEKTDSIDHEVHSFVALCLYHVVTLSTGSGLFPLSLDRSDLFSRADVCLALPRKKPLWLDWSLFYLGSVLDIFLPGFRIRPPII